MKDRAYHKLKYRPNEIRHCYGPRVHILSDPVLVSRVLRLSLPTTQSIEGSLLLRWVYRDLMRVTMAAEFPRRPIAEPTRMARTDAAAVWEGEAIDPDTLAVSIALARAGLISSQVCYEEMGTLLQPDHVRQDFLMVERRTTRSGRVTGADAFGAKVGGTYAGRIVIIPDPMGATGGSLDLAIRFVRRRAGGKQLAKLILVMLVITPEFIQRICAAHPDAIIYAARLDRGLSSAKALAALPGAHPDQESGLNERGYIVPGLGGLGEYLNNAEK
jgi:uracil phosphoribosyltransferase